MTKIQMTDPICYANVVDIESYKESPRVNRRIPGAYDVPLYTKDQAEAYKDACVREALEEVAEIADQHNAFSTYDAIRALILKEE